MMPKGLGQVNVTVLIILAVVIFLFFSLFNSFLGFSPENMLLWVLVIAVLLVTLVNINISLIILIFSMLLSPEFVLGELGVARRIVIRVDDILLLVVCFTWLVKMAMNKQLGLLKFTPLQVPLLLFIGACVISTSLALLADEISLQESYFYILKYFEYFLLYFMVVNNINSFKQIKIFTAFLFLVCIIVSFYTYPQIAALEKTTAPFEGPGGGEPNTLGGYQILLLAISAGVLLYTKSPFWRFSSIGLIVSTFPSFLYTQSRGSYLGFIFMYAAFILLSRKTRILFIVLLVIAILIFPFVIPRVVTDRIAYTFKSGEKFDVFGETVILEDAAAARVKNLRLVFREWKKRPVFGYGVTGVRLVDTQYARVLGETGIVGSWIFVWMLVAIFKICFRAFKATDDNWSKGLIIGFQAGFIGLLFHSFSAETFIIVRIMEPFWFFLAMINFISNKANAEANAEKSA
ncbi:MAG: O-antigen ligase family protein [Candidatus Omnitrophica bacterium]|nr:O-antigen ligase family protein [Candidatus Omnitrophota bacterium]